MLEAKSHHNSCFTTLTYDQDHLPPGSTLNPQDCTLFLKRLRKSIGKDRSIRYYLVGEYGDQSQRPHYHAAVFGMHESENDRIHDCWGHGSTFTGGLTYDSAQYIAGYVTKKLTSRHDPRLNGRHPEFARMSLRPGIGALSIPAFSEPLSTEHGAAELARLGDVPTSFREGGQSRPLGRYLRSKLRSELGIDAETVKDNVHETQQNEMLTLLQTSGDTTSFIAAKEKIDLAKRLQIVAKHKIYSGKSKI